MHGLGVASYATACVVFVVCLVATVGVFAQESSQRVPEGLWGDKAPIVTPVPKVPLKAQLRVPKAGHTSPLKKGGRYKVKRIK